MDKILEKINKDDRKEIYFLSDLSKYFSRNTVKNVSQVD